MLDKIPLAVVSRTVAEMREVDDLHRLATRDHDLYVDITQVRLEKSVRPRLRPIRLLEREGIYWYFEHTNGKHELVLLDSLSAHDTIQGKSDIRYIEDPSSPPPDEEFIYNWQSFEQVNSGEAVLTSYDFERPATSLLAGASVARPHAHADGEVLDFQGDYTELEEGKQYAEDWLDEFQTRHHLLRGEGTLRHPTDTLDSDEAICFDLAHDQAELIHVRKQHYAG